MRIQAGGEPFFFKGNQVGCLLVHGFPGTPQEMRWLGEFLQNQGYSVLGVRLSGHATQPSDLLRVRSSDWLADLEDGYHWLSGTCTRIYMIGFQGISPRICTHAVFKELGLMPIRSCIR